MIKKISFFMAMIWIAGPALADDAETNRQILRDAVVGAVTGVAAVEATKDDRNPDLSKSTEPVITDNTDKKKEARSNFTKKKRKWKKDKSGEWRPPGWDRGKKTGWGDSDVPRGLAKKQADKD